MMKELVFGLLLASHTLVIAESLTERSPSPPAKPVPVVQSTEQIEAIEVCSKIGALSAECTTLLLNEWGGVQAQRLLTDARALGPQVVAHCQQIADWLAVERCAARKFGDKATALTIAYAAALVKPEIDAALEEREAVARRIVEGQCRKAGYTLGKVRIGMSAATVRKCGWGNPDSINETVHRGGRFEQWVYGSGTYLYLRNGVVESLQRSTSD